MNEVLEQERLTGVESSITLDIIVDSVWVKTTYKATLAEKGMMSEVAQLELGFM